MIHVVWDGLLCGDLIKGQLNIGRYRAKHEHMDKIIEPVLYFVILSLQDGCYWCYNSLLCKNDIKLEVIRSTGTGKPTANITHANPYAGHHLPKEIFAPRLVFDI